MLRRVAGLFLIVGTLVYMTSLAYAQYDYGPPPAQAQAGKVETQLRTAIDHAKNSTGSGTLGEAANHLGHTLNCIEGTKGKNFNGSWGHVCQGQGDGILVDIKGARNAANVMLVLEAADSLAVAGVKAKDLGAVQNAARGVGALLQVVADSIK